MPRRFERAILSRMRSPATSRSNWAKDSSTFSVNRPMEVEVLKLLGDGDKGRAVRIKPLGQLGEVSERAGEAVDLVDDHDVDLPALHVSEEPLQGGPLHGAS